MVRAIMNVARIAAATTALAALVAPVAGSSAPVEPILVMNVQTHTESSGNPKPSFLLVEFQNQSDATAKEVVFHITDPAGNQALVDDLGTFSQGVVIRHHFMILGLKKVQAEVVRVRFADGSTWERHYPAPPEREQAI
jgi:hypothetical protein